MITLPDAARKSPNYKYTIELDGFNCSISMVWNVRAGAWYLSIEDGVGGRVDSVRVVANRPLLRTFRAQLAVTGDIIATIDTKPPTDPQYYSFEEAHKLQYMTTAEVKDWETLNGVR